MNALLTRIQYIIPIQYTWYISILSVGCFVPVYTSFANNIVGNSDSEWYLNVEIIIFFISSPRTTSPIRNDYINVSFISYLYAAYTRYYNMSMIII